MVFKPSNTNPNLSEIDVTNKKDSVFSCQVNTSGTTIKAYKINLLSGDGTKEILAPTTPTELPKPLINKAILTSNNINSTNVPALINGENYQWNIRTYELLPRYNGATKLNDNQPKTLICSGFLVGSTTSVLWVPNNEAILYDMWVEIKGINFMPLPDGNPDNVVLPTDPNYKERHQIYWVDRELGWDKNYTKITLEEPFEYNYRNGTSVDIYQCSNAHTLTSIYVDPNDDIERGNFIELYRGGTKICDKTKIIGWGEITGEIRFQEALKITDTANKFPQDGDTYKLYTYNALDKTYTEVTVEDNVLGGKPVVSTTIFANDEGIYFIQPNINIKTDGTNPPEIVFENGARLALIKKTSNIAVPNKVTDVTFDKLDNTQWVVKYGQKVNNIDINISPKTKYTVYTDFMDSMPNSIFYARKAPNITIQYRAMSELEASGAYENVTDNKNTGWRDIDFKTLWDADTEVKYYQYLLYDEDRELITQSDELYNSELEWSFRGFESGIVSSAPKIYFVAIKIVDEYDKEFLSNQVSFKVYYPVEAGLVPLDVQYDCEEQGISVIAQAPVYVGSTDKYNKTSIDSSDKRESSLSIGANKVANYEYILSNNENKVPINITNTFSFLSQFQLTNDFITSIENGQEQTVLEIGHRSKNGSTIDILSLKMSGQNAFYTETDSAGNITIKKSDEVLTLKWYKNGEKQKWVKVKDSTELIEGYSLPLNLKTSSQNKNLIVPEKIAYALQNTSNIILPPTDSSGEQIPLNEIGDFDTEPGAGNRVERKIWVCRKLIGYRKTDRTDGYDSTKESDYIHDSKGNRIQVYQYILYKYSEKEVAFVPYQDTSFLLVENLNQLPQGYQSYELFQVPEECQAGNNLIGWGNTSDNTLAFLENSGDIQENNKLVFNSIWIDINLMIDNDGDQEIASCEFAIDTFKV